MGIANPTDLSARDVERLESLVLIEEDGAGLRLTPTGTKRYLVLPKSAGFDAGASDEALAKMAEFISKARD